MSIHKQGLIDRRSGVANEHRFWVEIRDVADSGIREQPNPGFCFLNEMQFTRKRWLETVSSTIVTLRYRIGLQNSDQQRSHHRVSP